MIDRILDTDELMVWFGLLLVAFVLAYATPGPCDHETEGTDAYWECVTQAPMDLTPREGK